MSLWSNQGISLLVSKKSPQYTAVTPEGSIPFSRQSDTCPYSKPDQSNPRPTILLRFMLILSYHLFPVLLTERFFTFLHQNTYTHFFSFHLTRYALLHPSWYECPSNRPSYLARCTYHRIPRRGPFSPVFCYALPLRPNCLPGDPQNSQPNFHTGVTDQVPDPYTTCRIIVLYTLM